MTPVFPNPPGPSMQDQSQLFVSPNNDEPTSLSYRTYFDIIDQRQTRDIRDFRHDHQEDGRLVFHGGSSSNIHQVCNSSSVSPQPVMVYPNSAHGHNLSLYKVEEEENKSVSESTKWMSSKIRLTRKMITPTNSVATNNIAFNTTTTTPTIFQNQGHGNTQTNASTYNGNSIIRVCSDCNTSSTPLWRSGPKGPKSLCNACGIRQRKARRAMAEAANGFATNSVVASSTKTRVVHHKEKKSRTKHFAQFKNKSKATSTTIAGTSEGEKKLDFKDFAVSLRNNNSGFQQVFPRDEVAEAALLLMELSCGFVYF